MFNCGTVPQVHTLLHHEGLLERVNSLCFHTSHRTLLNCSMYEVPIAHAILYRQAYHRHSGARARGNANFRPKNESIVSMGIQQCHVCCTCVRSGNCLKLSTHCVELRMQVTTQGRNHEQSRGEERASVLCVHGDRHPEHVDRDVATPFPAGINRSSHRIQGLCRVAEFCKFHRTTRSELPNGTNAAGLVLPMAVATCQSLRVRRSGALGSGAPMGEAIHHFWTLFDCLHFLEWGISVRVHIVHVTLSYASLR